MKLIIKVTICKYASLIYIHLIIFNNLNSFDFDSLQNFLDWISWYFILYSMFLFLYKK